MFLSAVLDPEAWKPLAPPDPRSSEGIELCLKGILANGQMLDDPHKRLSRSVGVMVAEAAKRNPRVTVLYERIIERLRVQMPRSAELDRPEADAKLVAAIADYSKADFVLTRQPMDIDYRKRVPPEGYGLSPAEETRRDYIENCPPLDMMAEQERDDFLRRILRFATYVRIYDKQIGRIYEKKKSDAENKKKLDRFYHGIRWFLKGWQKHWLRDGEHQVVEIITSVPKSINGLEEADEQETKRAENEWARELLMRNLLARLESELSLPLRLQWKNDVYGIFHARHIQTKATCVLVERGFDLFRADGSWQRAIVKCGRAESAHLQECRNLPDA